MIKISNFKLGIGIPNTFPYVNSGFFDSFIQMDKPDFVYLPAKNGPIEDLRNNIVSRAIDAGCSHILFLDIDQSYPKDTIPKLLRHKLPIVHGMVHRRYPDFDPILYKGEIGRYELITDYEEGSLLEVDATGTACVLYETRIFRDMEFPWFEFSKIEDGKTVGEDIGFCSRLRKKGYKIFVDTSIEVIHYAIIGVEKNFHRLYKNLLNNRRK
jgi:GT2 family glycosyltransferase